jgi:hypothetical protein
MAILSRSFYDSSGTDERSFVEHLFAYGVKEIRSYEKEIKKSRMTSSSATINTSLSV